MPRIKGKLVPGAMVLLAVVLGSLLFRPLSDSAGPGRLRLPVGQGTPAISLGERHGLILASDGSLWSWGSDFLGWPVLGLGTLTNRTTSLRRIGQDTNWVSISASSTHNLALKADGSLWTWGESVQPQFARLTGTLSPVPAAPGNDWKQAAAGGIHCVAIKRDGTLWGWGNNWSGSVGIPSTTGSAVPVQIGSATNWTKVWAAGIETVARQADGSLWYWGENPDEALAKQGKQILTPTRISPDTNWVDVGFGERTVLAIKSDGTLWAWGQKAHVFTGARDPAQNTVPARVGTDSDWRSISASTPWWCKGLTKKDGSLWLLDASQGKWNGPRPPYQPAQFRRMELSRDYVAYAGGAVHGAAAGVHGPIGVVLRADGEVWTWGAMLGDPPTWKSHCLELAASVAGLFHGKVSPTEPGLAIRKTPWRLRNIEPVGPTKP